MPTPVLPPDRDQLIRELSALIGAKYVLSDPQEMQPFVREWRGIFHGQANLVVRPANVGEVSALLCYANTHKLRIIPQGGNTVWWAAIHLTKAVRTSFYLSPD